MKTQWSLFSAGDGTGIKTGADFSPCGRWRYVLWRKWDPSKMSLVFIMLNPSIADAERDDPTVARCGERARRLGYGGLTVVNIFAWVSTDPKELLKVTDPVGRGNDEAISKAVLQSDAVVVAWGKHGGIGGRAAAVLELLKDRPLLCLGVNKDGSPEHPLYIGYDVELKDYPR